MQSDMKNWSLGEVVFLPKEPQYYDRFGLLTATLGNETHNRLTIVYFYKSNISW